MSEKKKLSVYVTDEEKALLDALSSRWGLSNNQTIVRAIALASSQDIPLGVTVNSTPTSTPIPLVDTSKIELLEQKIESLELTVNSINTSTPLEVEVDNSKLEVLEQKLESLELKVNSINTSTLLEVEVDNSKLEVLEQRLGKVEDAIAGLAERVDFLDSCLGDVPSEGKVEAIVEKALGGDRGKKLLALTEGTG